MVGKWNKSVILTYVGLLFSVVGIYLCINYTEYIKLSFILLIIAGICDLFDGFVARKCKRTEEEKAFGIELDSLVDVVSFLVFPLVLLFSLGAGRWYDLAVAVVYVIFGIARLGYFNITTADSDKVVSHYIGLPVTYSALILPSLYLILSVIVKTAFNEIFSIAMLIIAGLYVLKVKIPKPTGIWYGVFSLLAIFEIVAYIFCI